MWGQTLQVSGRWHQPSICDFDTLFLISTFNTLFQEQSIGVSGNYSVRPKSTLTVMHCLKHIP